MLADYLPRKFRLAQSLPSSGRLCALVKDSVAVPLRTVIEATGHAPDVCRSRHRGWTEWRDLMAETLLGVPFSTHPLLSRIDALRPVLPPPQIHFRGGVRAGDAFVALPGLLPLVEAVDADAVWLLLEDGSRIPLDFDESPTTRLWRIPDTAIQVGLVGQHRLSAYSFDTFIAAKDIAFTARVLTTEYKTPAYEGRFLFEAGLTDVAALNAQTDLNPWQEMPAPIFEGQLHAPPKAMTERSCPNWPKIDAALSSIACVSAAQRGLAERDLASLLIDTLEVSGPILWSVMRAWVENGLLDTLVDSRWRAKLYFARRPTLVAYADGKTVFAVLMGLAPPYLRNRFVEATRFLGLEAVTRSSSSDFVPPIACCRAESMSQLDRLQQELELPNVMSLSPPWVLASSLSNIISVMRPEPMNWPVYRRWDWVDLAFSQYPRESTHQGISLVWCRRDDGPDCYKVYKDEGLAWWSRSRAWSVLAAMDLAGSPAFEFGDGGSVLTTSPSINLPLPLARFAAATGPTAPGPIPVTTGTTRYHYTFPAHDVARVVLGVLWPSMFHRRSAPIATLRGIWAICNSPGDRKVPLPLGLRRSLEAAVGPSLLREAGLPWLVPAASLPRLFHFARSLHNGGEWS